MRRRDMLQLGAVAGASLATSAANAAETPLRPFGSRLTTHDGVGLHVSDWGQGRPILFVHSWALTSEMWGYQVAAFLAAGHRCVAYDRRGHGRSDIPNRGYDYDTLADDLAAVIDGLDLDHVTLVAHSMGGGEVVRYITRHGRARVARIVLLAPTTPGMARSAQNPNGLDPKIFEQVRSVWARDFPHWVDDNTDAFFTPQTSPGMKRWLSQMMTRVPLQVALATNQAIVGTDFRAELPQLGVPLLVVHGDQDKSAPLAMTGQPTAALVSGARLEILPGAPHGLFVTHLDQINAHVLNFLQA